MKFTQIYQGKRRIAILQSLLVLSGITLSVTALSEEYYRWTDESGIVHYGSTPPSGVEATKVKTYGSKANRGTTPANPSTDAAASGNLPPEEAERRRKVADAQKKACDEEKSRLELLNQPTRLRMKDAEGNTRVLSQDEVMQEIEVSKKFIQDYCS